MEDSKKRSHVTRSRNAKGTLFLMSAIPTLMNLFIDVLKKIGVDFATENDALYIKDIYLLDFMERVFKTGLLSDVVSREIKVLFLEESEEISFSKIANIRTLLKYKKEIESAELFEMFEQERFEVHFQPIIDIKNNTIYGYEALIRGIRTDGSLVLPREIFGFAKDNDLIFFLDRKARELAIINASKHGIEKKLFINFTPTAIYEPFYCLQTTLKIAKELKFNPENIVLELVETEKVKDAAHIKKIIDYYKTNKFLTALDDVGSGYSSLNLMISLQPDIIKIDRGIMDRIDEDKLKQSVFKALVNAAKNTSIKVLAEGIEREEEYIFARENGADFMQGYYFARPSSVPAKEIRGKV